MRRRAALWCAALSRAVLCCAGRKAALTPSRGGCAPRPGIPPPCCPPPAGSRTPSRLQQGGRVRIVRCPGVHSHSLGSAQGPRLKARHSVCCGQGDTLPKAQPLPTKSDMRRQLHGPSVQPIQRPAELLPQACMRARGPRTGQRQRHEDRLGAPAGLEPKGGAAVVDEVELHIPARSTHSTHSAHSARLSMHSMHSLGTAAPARPELGSPPPWRA